MPNILPSFELDRLSFWFGFLTGALFLWVLGRMRPLLKHLGVDLQNQLRAAKSSLMAGVEAHHANDTLRQAQHQHLASLLFSLDEILIPPQLLAPPPMLDPAQPVHNEDEPGPALPFLPDWPEMGSLFGAPRLTLVQALQEGASLILLGEPGSGKSVALAHLASQLARQDPELENLTGRVPFLVHAAELSLPAAADTDLLAPLIATVSSHASRLALPRLPKFIGQTFESGRALVLLDGLDELPADQALTAAGYLAGVVQQYPSTLCVAAGSPGSYLPLANLGFVPLPVAPWTPAQRQAFINQWSDRWTRYVARPSAPDGSAPQAAELDPLILNGWLMTDAQPLNPLELTLKVWGAHAADLSGPSIPDALEAYFRRMSWPASGIQHEEEEGLRAVASRLAAGAFLDQQPFPSYSQAETWINTESSGDSSEGAQGPMQAGANLLPRQSQKAITTWLESGLLRELQGPTGRLSFPHLEIAAYLAGDYLAGAWVEVQLLSQPAWSGRSLALGWTARCSPAPWVQGQILPPEQDPLLTGLLEAARWLRTAPEKAPWRSGVMRAIAEIFQRADLSSSLRIRLTAAAVCSNSSGLGALFRQFLHSSETDQRRLAALASGMLREPKAISDLAALMADPSPEVRQAACLALAAAGTIPALEALGAALLNGDESLRRLAAQALANHPEEGHAMLVEGAGMEDVTVRRAVVSGLRHVRQPWAGDLLRKLQADPQWVVQSAAEQALEDWSTSDPNIPHPQPALHDTPWLIAFAGEKGVGVAPGKAAEEVLLQALHNGSEAQKLAAMQWAARFAWEPALQPLFELQSSRGRLQDGAFEALWSLANAGVPLAS